MEVRARKMGGMEEGDILNSRVIVSSLARRRGGGRIKGYSTMLRTQHTYQACWLTSVTWGDAIIKRQGRGEEKMAYKNRTTLFFKRMEGGSMTSVKVNQARSRGLTEPIRQDLEPQTVSSPPLSRTSSEISHQHFPENNKTKIYHICTNSFRHPCRPRSTLNRCGASQLNKV